MHTNVDSFTFQTSLFPYNVVNITNTIKYLIHDTMGQN